MAAPAVWPQHLQRQAALAKVDQRLAAGETDAALLLARADLLAQLNEGEAAQVAYLALLTAAPDHQAGLNNFAALALARGHASAARTLYARAAAVHPHHAASQANLGASLAREGDFAAAASAFRAALTADPDLAAARRGLARLLSREGDLAGAERELAAAFATEPVIEPPYVGAQAPIDVLLLISGLDGDVPLTAVLDPTRFRVRALAPQFFAAGAPLPAHEVIFNAIGEADLCQEALAAAVQLVARSGRPVINRPDRVALTGRAANAARLGALAGVTAPTLVEAAVAELALWPAERFTDLGLAFPLAVRAPGFHTGQFFERVERFADLAPALADWPGEQALVMNLLEARGGDGRWRKYRVMLVDGAVMPLHLAVSRSWKVHYFTADMEAEAVYRAQDAAFLADMAGALGPEAMGALARIQAEIGLDYAGVDFALGPDGEILLFEANATMVVQPPPVGAVWDYRRPAAEAVIAAVRAMIVERAGR